MARHSPDCRHCRRVRTLALDFRAWRTAWEADLEQTAVGYASEGDDFRAEHRAPTFRQYLESIAS